MLEDTDIEQALRFCGETAKKDESASGFAITGKARMVFIDVDDDGNARLDAGFPD